MWERLLGPIGAAIITVVGTAGTILGTAADNAGLAAGTAFTTLALAGFTLMWNTYRKEIRRLTTKCNESERVNGLLVRVCRENGVDIPDKVWSGGGS